MSITTIYKTCPKCGMTYTFNPDVGRFEIICPHCRGSIKTEFIKKILNKGKKL